MSDDWRPFVVRRTTGGDVLQAADPLGWRGALRWGARVVTPEEVSSVALLARPYRYEGAIVTVQVPMSVEWEQAVLVRGGFGYPTTPQDGVVVWYTDQRPMIGATEINLSQEAVDRPLTACRWYYYSLFLWIAEQWVKAAEVDVLVPMDCGWSDLLFGTIPPFYQKADDEAAADGRNGVLRRFTEVLGYDLDYTQCLCEGILNIYSFDLAPWRLLQYLGGNLGFPYEAALGANRSRSVLEQLDDLNQLRGTILGLERLVTAASDYECDVVQGYNELLALDDGDFTGGAAPVGDSDPMLWGIGHWTNLTNATILAQIDDPIGGTSPTTTAAAVLAKNLTPGPSGILTPPGGGGALVLNGPGPNTVLAIGNFNTPAPAGASPDQNPVITGGIPVFPGNVYEYSIEHIRTGWGVAAQQPPEARVILSVHWYDSAGAYLETDTGTTPPPNDHDFTTWHRTSIEATAPDDAYYAVLTIWWKHASAWTPYTTPTSRPTFGRYVSMASFGTIVDVSGAGSVFPVTADIFLTLGVADKTLGSDESYLGEAD